jgi:hypothetical protein
MVIPEERGNAGLEALAGEGWPTTGFSLNAIKLRDCGFRL